VLVSVDAKGRVTGAEGDAGSQGQNPVLVNLALAAAREWRFKPATQGGTAIPGEHRIEFLFRPPADRVWHGH
jgi:TonB family protein